MRAGIEGSRGFRCLFPLRLVGAAQPLLAPKYLTKGGNDPRLSPVLFHLSLTFFPFSLFQHGPSPSLRASC